MNTQQQHTAEPWEVHGKEVRSGGFTVAAIPQRSMAAVGKFRYAELQETDSANARHIVACVNACEGQSLLGTAGFKTDELESIAEIGGLHSVLKAVERERDIAEQQRDKLLAACKVARHRISNLSLALHGTAPFDDPLDGPVLRNIDAIIAEIEAAK